MRATVRMRTAVLVAGTLGLTGFGLATATAATASTACSYSTATAGADRIRTGSTLGPGKKITSPNGAYTFGVTADGGLQITNTATGGRRWLKQGDAGSSLTFSSAGLATFTSSKGAAVWTSLPSTACTELVVENVGRVSAVDNGTVLWTLPVSASQLRDPAVYPFVASAPWNTPLGTGATFESASGTKTKTLLGGSPVVNSARWSFAIFRATSSDPMVTVTNTQNGKTYQLRIPSTAATTYGTDKHMGVIDPGGTVAWEFYKMNKVDSTHWTTTRVTLTDLKGDGFGGSRASSISIFAGLIRTKELNADSINHTLAMGIPNSMLKSGFVWPALSQDTDGPSLYTGTIPMGSLVGIPKSVDITKLGLKTPEALALARALQDYGAYVLLRSDTVALFCEASCDATRAKNLNDAWWTLYPQMRVMTNNSVTNVGGGGTPLVASLSALK